jgi:hypothetical protein
MTAAGLPASPPEDALLAARNFDSSAPSKKRRGASDQTALAILSERFQEHCEAVAQTPASTARRQQRTFQLAQAYALTGDERYAARSLSALEEWGTAGAADAGFDLLARCWSLVLLRSSSALTTLRLCDAIEALRQRAVGLSADDARLSAPATTVIVNALALFYVATLLPELRESSRWRDLAVRVLVAECERQVHADGVHFEQSTSFQFYAVDVYLHFLLLAERNRVEVPSVVGERLQRMLEFILAIRTPDGTVPSIGDSDGGTLLPLMSRPALDARGRFAVAATLFGRSDFAWAAGSATPEIAWLMGASGLRAFDALRPSTPTASASRAFPAGGYAIMRSGWDRGAHHMLVDVGPLGCPVSGAHGHADLLSIQCSIFGDPVVVDPGTHCYGDSRWRDFFRSTAAHSTVVVDGLSQVEPSGVFGWNRRPRVRLREWHSTADVDFLDAEHDGYATLRQPVTHRRRVIFIKPSDAAQGGPSYWIMVDDLSGSGRHDVELRFQLTGETVTLGPHPWARAKTARGHCLWISPFPSAPAQPAVKCGEPAPICGWIAPEFTRLSPAPMLIYSFAVALPWRIVTLLLPDRQGLMTPPGVRPIYDTGGLPHGFVFERPRRLVRFDDQAVVVERD